MESVLYYVASAVAVFSSIMVVTRLNAVHALLYLILSLLAVGIVFYLLGAHFAAVLEVIIYAGAIMVLFVFVIMMLNQGQKTVIQEQTWLQPRMWIGPVILSSVLLVELVIVFVKGEDAAAGQIIDAKQVGTTLFGPYLLAVELASILLLAGLVGAYHLGRPTTESQQQRETEEET